MSAKHQHAHEIACPECGCIFKAPRMRKRRSLADHRRFFAVVAAAFDQWPHDHEFHPISEEHLRAWLLCKAKHHEVDMIGLGTEIFGDLDGAAREIVELVVQSAVRRSIEAAVRNTGFAFDKPSGNRIAIFRPKSINWETISQTEFNEIRERVEAEIEAAIGVPVAQLLKAREMIA